MDHAKQISLKSLFEEKRSAESEFYHRVSEHGRYSDYIGKVPIYLSSNPNAGLLGARAALNNNNLKHRLI